MNNDKSPTITHPVFVIRHPIYGADSGFLASISASNELQKSAANEVCVSALLSSFFQFITGDTAFANSRYRPTYISEGE
jgi:hypothetical protein